MRKIHPTALISPKAEIGENVEIGAYTIIHGDVEIGSDSQIGAYCELGFASTMSNKRSGLVIGYSSVIRSHAVIYSGSMFEPKLETGHHVTIRENTRAGVNFRVGSYSDLQGDIYIGDYVRLHSGVHIAKRTIIGNYVWIFPYVVTTNDPLPPSNKCLGCEIGDFAVISTGSILLPGVKVGSNALVGARSTVTRDVGSYSLVVGSPAKHLKDIRELTQEPGSRKSAYPWRQHFHDGYPKEIIDKWTQEFGKDSTDHEL